MFEIKRYKKENRNEWDLFVDDSKNSTFLFKRDYMDYHADRFHDHSFLIYRKGKLQALFPANIKDDVLYSHQGLTYGGLLMSSKLTTLDVLSIFDIINNQLKSVDVKKVVYKAIPYIYHSIPAQEDLYALFKCCDARIIGRNISSTIFQKSKIRFIESRKSGIRKAKDNDVSVRTSTDYKSFWKILDDNLSLKYGKAPVHSLDEIELLSGRFPENIKLYLAYEGNIAVGGTVLYISKDVVHTQYISANERGKNIGALDLLFDFLINVEYVDFPKFDFGQSTEEMGNILNEPLMFQKEGFGGRGVVYDIYEYYL